MATLHRTGVLPERIASVTPRMPARARVPNWGRIDAVHGDGWGWTRHELSLRPPDLTRRQRVALLVHDWAYAIGGGAGFLAALAAGGTAPDWFAPLALATGLFPVGFGLRRGMSATAALVRRVSATTAYFDGAPHRVESEWARYERAVARMRTLEAELRSGAIDRSGFDAGWLDVWRSLPDRRRAG